MKYLSLMTAALAFSVHTLSAEITPESSAAAKELAQVIDLKSQMNAGFDAMQPVIDQQAVQFGLKGDQKTELMHIYKAWFTEDIDQQKMVDDILKIYADKFSAKELKELTKFYQTPLGKKTLIVLPEITKQAAIAGMKEAQSKQHLLMERLKPFFKNLKK